MTSVSHNVYYFTLFDMRDHEHAVSTLLHCFLIVRNMYDNYTDGTGKNCTTKLTNTENMAPHISSKINITRAQKHLKK